MYVCEYVHYMSLDFIEFFSHSMPQTLYNTFNAASYSAPLKSTLFKAGSHLKLEVVGRIRRCFRCSSLKKDQFLRGSCPKIKKIFVGACDKFRSLLVLACIQ